MKKHILPLLTLCAVMFNITACSTVSTTDSASDNSQISETPSLPETLPESTDSGEITEKQGAFYDDVFKGVGISPTSAPMSYEQIVDILGNEPEHPEWDTDSLYLVEVIKAFSSDECKAIAGWDEEYSIQTTYEVKVLKDLISGETVDRTENIVISMGCVEWQDKGDPIYAPGERFTVVLSKPYEGCDFLRTPAAFALRYDAVEEDGEIVLYSRRSELDALNIPTSKKVEESIVTSTTLNPAIHSQKLTLTAFADYLREDWEKRGLTSHYER